MQPRLLMVLLLGATACGRLLGIEDLNGPSDARLEGPGGDTPNLAECRAQRAVHLVGGSGGFAWFTQVWPPPAVITGFQPGYAYDTPANAKDVSSEPSHPLFARVIGTRVVWDGLGGDPQPSVFVAGVNETHTVQPTSTTQNGGTGLPAAGAAIQAALAPMVAVLQFSPAGPYGTAPGAPIPVLVSDVESAIDVFPAELEPLLRPTPAQLASYVPPGAVQVEINLGSRLAFTANAFRAGLVGSVILQAFADDPHGAFTNGPPTQRANNLAAMLDAFYRDLSMGSELTCGRGGGPLSLADNVVTIVNGDTPKNSFVTGGWPDGTPGNSNWLYVRSNGFTRPGWFGQIQPNLRTNFDPNTGALDPAAGTAGSNGAAFAGALYAIARGDKAVVRTFTNVPFDGVILR